MLFVIFAVFMFSVLIFALSLAKSSAWADAEMDRMLEELENENLQKM